MKTIITGGAGFIGSNYVYYMLERYPDEQFICVDKLTYAGSPENLEAALNNENFKFIKGDIADRDLMYRIFKEEKPDVL